MSTNGSDIISKRNVERVYFPTEPQYARFFVKKLQKRTPLNNRIFYLRMHLVDAAICQFLTRPSQKSKVIVNLGCGSDTLPWRCMFRHARLCLGAKFVDIDSPEVLMPKRDIVKQTPELLSPLTSPEFPENSSILLTSDQYCQIACNLHQLSEIEHALPKFIDVDTSEFLFVAEISMAHIEVGDADALIRWAGAIGDAEFCLLEPTLPDGPSSPFTEAMLQQLAKDKVSSKSVEHYPTINSQQKRFKALGWPNARARSWWHAWSDPLCMSPSQRKVLDTVEDFDDWEEFVYFASHRCVLHAQTAALLTESPSQGSLAEETDMSEIPTTAVDVTFSPPITTKNVSPRRSGAPMVLQTIMGQNVVANIFGHGPDGQLRSCDLYSKSSDPEAASRIVLPQGGPGARSCFTLTDLGDSGYLLAGGKGSHAAPFSDCWIFKKDTHQWVEVHSLPFPLFRHSVERLGNSKLVLLAGGRLDFTATHSDFLVFHPNIGWMRCSVKGTLQPPAIYGCFLSCTGSMKLIPSAFCGILAGGMTTDGVVFNEALEWVLDVSNITEPTITFKPIASRWPNQLLARYGAVSARAGDWVVVVGGVGTTGTLPASQEIVRFRSYGERSEVYEYLEFVQGFGPEAWRTFSTGASIVAVDNSEIAIIGGGTHCFSTESGWSRGVYSFPIRGSSVSVKSTRERAVWKYSRTLTVTNEAPATPHETNPQRLPSKTTIPRVELKSAEHFESILRSGKPVVFENLELGSCLAKWSLTYLAERVGPERKVVVHESMDQAMDFLAKNFRYKTQTFQEFAGDVDNGKKLYLRALSADKPSGAPSILDVDFPMIARDFILPPQLAFVDDKLFSSVLRISGPVNMWLHYDVLANIYCQIEGIKRFYLFPPTDVTKLGFAPGSSSSSIDVFSALTSSSLPQCNIYEAILKPGDVLFLPQLWLHTATPVSDSSIAVNVFFRDLEKGYSSGRDVYGNRDLAAYEKARQDVSRMSGAFKDLPRDTKQFYLRRLADELLQIATE